MAAEWHLTEDKLPNVGWPVIGEDSTGRRQPMLYGEEDGQDFWQIELRGGDYREAEFVPVRWRYQNRIQAMQA